MNGFEKRTAKAVLFFVRSLKQRVPNIVDNKCQGRKVRNIMESQEEAFLTTCEELKRAYFLLEHSSPVLHLVLRKEFAP